MRGLDDSRRAPAGDSAGPSSLAVDSDAFPGDWRRVRAFAERPAAPAAPAPARERPTPAAPASAAAIHGCRISETLALHAGLCVQCEAGDGCAAAFRCCMGSCEYEFPSFSALRRHQNSNAHCADQWIVDEASASCATRGLPTAAHWELRVWTVRPEVHQCTIPVRTSGATQRQSR